MCFGATLAADRWATHIGSRHRVGMWGFCAVRADLPSRVGRIRRRPASAPAQRAGGQRGAAPAACMRPWRPAARRLGPTGRRRSALRDERKTRAAGRGAGGLTSNVKTTNDGRSLRETSLFILAQRLLPRPVLYPSVAPAEAAAALCRRPLWGRALPKLPRANSSD